MALRLHAALDPQKVNAFAGHFRAGGYPEEQHLFITERVGFVVTGDWFLNSLAKAAPELDFGMTVMPVPEEGAESATWAGGWSAVIPQAPRTRGRLEVHPVLRRGARPADLHHRDRAHADDQNLARGHQSL